MCVLRFVGPRREASTLAAALRAAGLDAEAHRSGRQVTVSVSDAPWTDLARQTKDAESFLARHEALIRRWAESPVVEGLVLDFPTEKNPQSAAQFFRFPASLVREAGALGVGLEISAYGIDDD